MGAGRGESWSENGPIVFVPEHGGLYLVPAPGKRQRLFSGRQSKPPQKEPSATNLLDEYSLEREHWTTGADHGRMTPS
jgi:hypothetical protein